MKNLRQYSFRLFAPAAAALILFSGVEPARAEQITTLFSTGVDASGTPLADGAVDSHYTINGGNPAYTVGNPGSVGWVGNTASSSWITPVIGTRGGPGPFTYLTTFDLTGFDSNTAVLTGMLASDDQASLILNGVDVLDTFDTPSNHPWDHFVSFTISSGFVSGVNTLEVYVPNTVEGVLTGDGPTGMQLDISGTASVPEPASFALVGASLFLIGSLRRKIGA